MLIPVSIARHLLAIIANPYETAHKSACKAGPVLARYVTLFNARDWDGMRAMLADDVRLDVVSAVRRQGRDEVGVYFGNYAKFADWRL